jgi:hypothetical protein
MTLVFVASLNPLPMVAFENSRLIAISPLVRPFAIPRKGLNPKPTCLNRFLSDARRCRGAISSEPLPCVSRGCVRRALPTGLITEPSRLMLR